MIEIMNICKSFEERTIFYDFSLSIRDREFLIITGNSGSGKTTLLNLIVGIETPDSGEIYIDGLNTKNQRDLLKIYREKAGFLFQNFALADNKSVLENLLFVDKKCRTNISPSSALEQVGLPGYEKRKIYTLSGGEQQRVAIARLLIKKCSIVLADEPTGNLDDQNTLLIMELLDDLNRQGKTIIMVTHDERIKHHATKTIHL